MDLLSAKKALNKKGAHKNIFETVSIETTKTPKTSTTLKIKLPSKKSMIKSKYYSII